MGHNEQAEEPFPDLKVPGPQATQLSPFAPTNPALHVQFVRTLLPMSEYECDGHAKHVDIDVAAKASLYLPPAHRAHAAVPLDSLNEPAGHSLHTPPSGPVYPLLHVQFESRMLPTPENVFKGHAPHVDSDVAPVADEYFPLPHGEQDAEPLTSLYVPARQTLQIPSSEPENPTMQVQFILSLLPSGEYEFGGHGKHADIDVAAIAPLYVPAGHRTHSAEPLDALYEPPRHAEQAPPSAPLHPALHVQLVSAELPISEYECDGHAKHVDIDVAAKASLYLPPAHRAHAAVPLDSLNEPAGHSLHTPPSGPVYPLLHVQFESRMLPTPENVFKGHAPHVDSDVAPVADEYFPLPHGEQDAEPLTSLYVPARQTLQIPSSEPENPTMQVQFILSLLPSGEYEFGGHGKHADIDVAAIAPLYVPAGHRTHSAEPLDALYEPPRHAEQAPPSAPLHPALHVQLVLNRLPVPEWDACGHLVHAVAPIVVEYMPCSHGAHVSRLVAPVSLEYLPAAHDLHALQSVPQT